MSAINIIGPTEYFDSKEINSSPNPFLDHLDIATRRGAVVKDYDDTSSYLEVTKLNYLNPALVAYWVSETGGEVENYPFYIKIVDASMTLPVPNYMPNKDWQIPVVNRTWEEYKDANHEHVSKDGFTYVSSYTFGEFLKGSILKQLIDDSFTVLSPAEYLAEVNGE